MSEEQDKKTNLSHVLPFELVEKSVGKKITVLSKGPRELTGTLRGYDRFANIILEDVVEIETSSNGEKTTKLDKVFLVHFDIAAIIPLEVDIPQAQ